MSEWVLWGSSFLLLLCETNPHNQGLSLPKEKCPRPCGELGAQEEREVVAGIRGMGWRVRAWGKLWRMRDRASMGGALSGLPSELRLSGMCEV